MPTPAGTGDAVADPALRDSLGTFDLHAMLDEAATAGHAQTPAGPARIHVASETETQIESLTPRPPARSAITRIGEGAPADPPRPDPKSAADDDRTRVRCLHCGRDVRGPKSLAGKRVKCPTCGESVLLPGAETAAEVRSTATELRLDRESARTQLQAAIQTAAALTPRTTGDESARPQTLRARDLRAARKTLKQVTNPASRGDSALQTARAALDRLIASGDPRSDAVILEVLDELPDALHCVALRGLGDLQSDEAFGPLLRALVDGIEPVVAAAIDGLGRLGDARATLPLAIVAADCNEQRRSAMEALTRLGPSALPPLNQLASPERQAAVREVAAEALGRIQDPRAAVPLARLAKDDEPAVRRAAIKALGSLSHRTVVKPLVAGLTDADEEVRLAAARGLADNPDPRAAPFLVKLLHDPSHAVRLEGIHALGLCGETDRSAELKPLLNCGDADIELAAVEAVARLGDRTALPRLLEMLEQATGTESDERWACRIIDALRRLTDPRAVLPLIEQLSSRSDRVRTRAAEALGAIGDPTALEPLIDRFPQEPSATAQAAVVKSLGELKDPGALPMLRQALEKSDPVRCKAIAALAEIGGPDATRLVVDQLHHASGPVRYQAVTALGRIGSAVTITHLEPLIGDADEMVRRAALKSLRELGDQRTDADLLAEFRKPAAPSTRAKPVRRSAPASARHWHALIPNAMYGLVTGRQLAVIAGGLLAVLLVTVGLSAWSPFGGGDPLPPRGFVQSLSFSRKGEVLLAGRGYGRIEQWNVARHALDETLTFARAQLVAQDAAGRFLVAGDANGSGIYDRKSGQRLVEETGIRSLKVNRAQTRAASEALDGRVIVWNLETGAIDAALQFDSTATSAFAVSPDGGLCAVGTSDGGLIIIDMQAGATLHEHALPETAAVTALGFNQDVTMLAVGTSTGDIHLWPLNAHRPAQTLIARFPETVKAAAFLDSGRLLSLRGLSIDVWDVAANSARTIPVPLETANAFALDESGSRVALGSSEESAIIVLDVATGQTLAELDLPLK